MSPRTLILLAIALCLALQAWLAFVQEYNWDEFFFLSHIYDYQRGEVTKALQTFHVHLLGWLTSVPGDELSQLRVGRLVMLACFAGSCALVYRLSATFLSRVAALVAVLVFASASFSIFHGASFRADPIATLFMMGSLTVLACARLNLKALLAAAGLAAVAAMITVKAGLYAPAFLGIAWWRISTDANRRAVIMWFAGAGAATAACFTILCLIQLDLMPKATAAGSRAGLGDAAEIQFGGSLLPRAREILQFILTSPIQSILLVTGFGAALEKLRSPESRAIAVASLGCGGTLLWLLVYRNAFPYFFPFILAPAAVLAGLAVQEFVIFRSRVPLLAFGLTVSAIILTVTWSGRDQHTQQQVVSTVHAMFPEPVNYIDRNSMIASFPKRGFFMSTWGLVRYLRGDTPVFQQLLDRETVPLVIANGPALENALGSLPDLEGELPLLRADKATLRANFIHHWGPLWVAGKTLAGSPRGTQFDMLIPGTYTIEGADAVIDDAAIPRGGTIDLKRGPHVLKSAAGRPVTLRWGNHLPRPSQPFVGPVYQGF